MTRVYIARSGLWQGRGHDPITPPSVGPVVPQAPELPMVEYTSLFHSGDTFIQALDRMTAPSAVHFPNGFEGDLNGFTILNQFGYFNLNNRMTGLYGEGVNQCLIRLLPMSSTPTQIAEIPAQSTNGSNPLTLFRVGTDPAIQTVVTGITFEGTDQALKVGADGVTRPHTYSGLLNYKGQNSWYTNLLLKSASYGDWSSPPGETFSLNCYRDTNTTIVNVEADGTNSAGVSVAGSPSGHNGSQNIVEIDCYYHDSHVSGLTFSFAGSPAPANITNGVHLIRPRIANNANVVMAAGQRFSGINFEAVGGKILIENPDIKMRQMPEWDNCHVSIAGNLADNPDVTIKEPVWYESPPHLSNCFCINMAVTYDGVPNAQTTVPTVIKNGITLTPHHIFSGPNSDLGLDPTRFFVVSH